MKYLYLILLSFGYIATFAQSRICDFPLENEENQLFGQQGMIYKYYDPIMNMYHSSRIDSVFISKNFQYQKVVSLGNESISERTTEEYYIWRGDSIFYKNVEFGQEEFHIHQNMPDSLFYRSEAEVMFRLLSTTYTLETPQCNYTDLWVVELRVGRQPFVIYIKKGLVQRLINF
jgi:hypothetical protein